MKGETMAPEGPDGDSPAVEDPPFANGIRATFPPENGKISSRSEDNSITLQASTLSTKSVEGKQTPKHAKEKGKKLQANLIGKINNLVTVDLKAIGSYCFL
jgi:hypothetical protein